MPSFSLCFWVGAESAHERGFGSQSFLKTPRQQLSLVVTWLARPWVSTSHPPSPLLLSQIWLAFSWLGWTSWTSPAQLVPASSSVGGFLLPYSHWGFPSLSSHLHVWNFSSKGSWKTTPELLEMWTGLWNPSLSRKDELDPSISHHLPK